ncbi:protein arginine N-methyltransferase 5 isoform X1 [Schistocerca nitens]|uniref:protein arginine N-methyltransferase 5 isoform X1 n=1 Tax=Schistocerca nitens TaxID=7011 RepID=UPI002118F116|nr:protein arginine N-methyltransferase 5 isoform X1 [Schistocerca nitens]
MSTSRRISCGLDFCSVPDIRASLQLASESGYDFACLPIVHPRFKREFLHGKSKDRTGPFTRSDLILSSSANLFFADWNNMIVGKLSPYIDVDSPDDTYRKQSEETLAQELAYAAHLGLPAIMFTLRSANNVNLSRLLNNKLLAGCCYQVWVHLPMESPSVAASYCRSDPEEFEQNNECEEANTWDWWNKLRCISNFEKKLGLALEISADIPPEDVITRWLGEPVKCIVLPTTVFITNKKGYPVLSRAHQNLVKQFANLDVQVIVRGATRHGYSKYYQQYLDHFWQTMLHTDALTAYARGYEDYLQCPLQPLMDNLESQTYEVFEKDPVKYNEYQRAIYTVLLDRIPFEEKNTNVQVLMVVGAGRGPLVRAALNAAHKADRKIRVYAVEKNPNAVVTLQAQQEELWGSQVTVVSCDMREWDAPEMADILVSELLGSFGDNELSPECLDGAQKFLKADGVSIPCSYTSYLCPVQSSKLYGEVRLCKEKDKHPLQHFEMPYVVHLQNKYQLAATQPLFRFDHPNRSKVMDNSRYKALTFDINQRSILHGFSGYFDTTLYKNITLSIVPETHTKGMFSWFPIFFPLREPVHLRAGEQLEVHFWRLSNKKSVWYEWCVTKPTPGPVHNPNGRSYTIGL